MLANYWYYHYSKTNPTCFFGYDANFEGDQSFIQSDGSNSFSSLFEVLIFN
jgi:hypothetical protein